MGNPAGYVLHEIPQRKWQTIMISIGPFIFNTLIGALVALPLRDGLQRGVTRLLYGERDEPWRAIRRLGQRLDLAADPERAYPAIVDTVADALRLPFVALELFDDSGRPSVAASRGQRRDPSITWLDGASDTLVADALAVTR